MANQEQLRILEQGAEIWNQWRKANTTGIDLSEADLRKAKLRDANLIVADLTWADLTGADLTGADLTRADLLDADLRMADLTGADLTGADLMEANLMGANLMEANLTNSQMGMTIFGSNDLGSSLGLETTRHTGPSTLGMDTIRASKGQLPVEFLRGCGLNDWEIEAVKLYRPDLNNNEFIDIQNRIFELRQGQSLQISPLFISYSRADKLFVDKLEIFLDQRGIRFWRDIHDAIAGRIDKQIDRAIRQNPTVLLVLSEHSIKSDWVEHEVRLARELEKEIERDVICPIALDNSWQHSPWPRRLMEQVLEYNILDYSGWENDDEFRNMFGRLVDGLNLYYQKDK